MTALTPLKPLTVSRSELILGGQKSGKSRRAESQALAWLAQSPAHHAVLIATAQAWDGEMHLRIARHQADRVVRVPGMRTVEEPLRLAHAIGEHSRADTLVVVDCLTLWLTNCLMPHKPASDSAQEDLQSTRSLVDVDSGLVATLLVAIAAAPGPVVLVGNEIGLGVIPLGAEVRAFVDALGLLNQGVAGVCERVVLMAASLPLVLKGSL